MIEFNGIKMSSPMEARKHLGVGKNRIYELINKKMIDHINYAGKTFITDRQIMSFYEKNTVRQSTPKLYAKGL